MRKRLARKIYFPSDVAPVYRNSTLSRAFHRLGMGNKSKWIKWPEFRARQAQRRATRKARQLGIAVEQLAELDRRLDEMDAEKSR